jgi:hypothetical protein
VERCGDGVDNDSDRKVDCADPDCALETKCQQAMETCGNGDDDNFNGLTDCDDPACVGNPECREIMEICGDGTDNADEDNLVDCQDPECSIDPGCAGVEICAGNVDEDNDNLIDCADDTCAEQACDRNSPRKVCRQGACVCQDSGPEAACTGGIDDDCDGLTDCNDSDCRTHPACLQVEACANGIDDNGNNLVDCQDDASCPAGAECGANGLRCDAQKACSCPEPGAELNCSDGKDNDCDGKVDCADESCAAQTCAANGRTCSNGVCACPGGIKELACGDGVDNDCDGLVDCKDGLDCTSKSCGPNGKTCNFNTTCVCPGGNTESACTGGGDEDCDGLVDCLDPDCAQNPACMGAKYDNGAPCTADAQCKGGRCYAEGSNLPFPRGMCTEACPQGTCANGGACIGSTEKWCFPTCTSTAGCRPGYGCFNQGTAAAPKLVCYPRCTDNAQCANGTCNLHSGFCEAVSTAVGQEGAACTSHLDCKSRLCLTENAFGQPRGYCAGRCIVSNGICPAGDTCQDLRNVPGDDQGLCLSRDGEACTSNSSGSCTRAGYACFQVTSHPNQPSKNACVPRCTADSQCTSGTCNLESGLCKADLGRAVTGDACATNADCESGRCILQRANGDYRNGYCESSCITRPSPNAVGAQYGVCPPDPNGLQNWCFRSTTQTDQRGYCRRHCGTQAGGAIPSFCRTAEGYVCTQPGGVNWACDYPATP